MRGLHGLFLASLAGVVPCSSWSLDAATRYLHSFGVRSRFGNESCFATAGGFGSWYYCCDEAFYGPGGNSHCFTEDVTFDMCCNHHSDLETRLLLAVEPVPCERGGELRQECLGERVCVQRVQGQPVCDGAHCRHRPNCLTLDEMSRRLCDAFAEASCRDSSGFDYLNWYADRLAPLGEAASVLELGVLRGSGLAMWAAYFPKGLAVGVDKTLREYHQNADTLRRRGFLRGLNHLAIETDATSPALLDALAELESESLRELSFDMIVDDASHFSRDIIRAFELLFPSRFFKPSGRYVIEDLDAKHGPDNQYVVRRYFQNLSSALLGGGPPLPAWLTGLELEITFLRRRIEVRRAGHIPSNFEALPMRRT